MFDGIDNIAWSQLIHAYGAASDVPDDIRALVSPDEKTAKDALWRLFGSIYHQGTRYTATAPAIPYLVEAAIAVEPARGAQIVNLLAAIVEPCAEIFLHKGLTIAQFRQYIDDAEQAMTAQARSDHAEYGTWPRVQTEVYDAVLGQLPRLLAQLDTTNSDIQVSVLELLGYLPDQRQEAESLTHKIFSDPNAGDVPRVAAIECLSDLGRSVEVAPYDAVFARLMTPDNTFFVRTHAAVAMTTQDEARFAQLLEALKNAEKLYSLDRLYERGGVWTATEVSHALTPWFQTCKEQICDAILESLPAASKTGANTYWMIQSLVAALASPAPAKDYFKSKPAKDLTPLERRALEHIVSYGTWKIGDKRLGNFKILIASFGLPDRPDEIKKYLRSDQSLLSRLLKR